ncbi:MAG: ribose 5-phosphate isomerase B [Bifidobacteriaceae bacterium]|jgi:ribose 5-phosphate isomerase B|nr:ribose 5-phosphate isomerase B [Bifidobacteriaceae bacterium]
MKIAVASDHAGYELKNSLLEYLTAEGIEYEDFGTYSLESTDYPEYGKLIGQKVASGQFSLGLLFCGTGVGISIAANKIKGVRAVVCSDTFTARASRQHNNSNILALGGRVVGVDLAKDIFDAWFNVQFEGGRHQRRIDLIEN